MYYLTKFYDTVLFQITSANLCKPIHDIINYSTFFCSFESEKCGKKGKEYLKNKKSFLSLRL